MLCIHHNDLDGRASAAIVARRLPKCRFVMADYRDFPFTEIQKEEQVIIVDYSPPADMWPAVVAQCAPTYVTWIDHHGTAIAAYEKLPASIKSQILGIQSTSGCGARLCWLYFYRDIPVPRSLDLIDAWDRHIFTPENKDAVIQFAMGMEINAQVPAAPMWEGIFADDTRILDIILSQGRIVVAYQEVEAARAIEDAYILDWEKRNWLTANTSLAASRLFDIWKDNTELFPEVTPRAQIVWLFDGKNYTVHLHSEEVDVSVLAKKYGGGGHPGAAGFVAKQLPWEEK